MLLEAVWIKDGKIIAQIDPVWTVENEDDTSSLNSIRVHNGHCWHYCGDMVDVEPDEFIVRIKKERYANAQ